MIFDENLPQTRGNCISVTVNDTNSEPKLKGPLFNDFDEKSEKLPLTGSSCISVTVYDTHPGQKLNWFIFAEF